MAGASQPRRAGPGGPAAPRPGRGLSRRSFLKRAVVVAVATPAALEALAACGNQLYTVGNLVIASPSHPVRWPYTHRHIEPGQTPKPGSTLRLYNYADYLAPGLMKAYEKETGVNIELSTFNDTDEALTKIATGSVAYDVYFPSYDQIGKMVTAKLLRPLTHSYMPNIKHVWPQFENPWYDLNWRYSVPYSTYTTGIGWRTDMVNEDIAKLPNPYDVFWDPAYRGNTAVIDDWHTAMSMVLLRNGIHDINTGNAADLDLLRNQLASMQRATNPRVTITMYNALPAGQFGIAQMWSGDIINAQYYLPKHTSPKILRYWFPPNGHGMVDNDLMVVLSGGSNPVAAHHFINYMLDPANAAKNFFYIGYQPPQKSISPHRVVADGYAPANLETAAVLPRYFKRGSRLLELPPVVDGRWHEIWQEYKANG
jgi:spermidine/putrescine transport system substrate-binding protein